MCINKTTYVTLCPHRVLDKNIYCNIVDRGNVVGCFNKKSGEMNLFSICNMDVLSETNLKRKVDILNETEEILNY